MINHSPRPRTDAPNHDDINTPTKKMKVMEVMNPRPIHGVEKKVFIQIVMTMKLINKIKSPIKWKICNGEEDK